MEVTLVNRLVYDLPSKQRVGCIAYDGAADMQLWPGPGPDSELRERYGDELQRSLDRELRTVDGRMLEVPSVIRVHRGRLHCNFLAWIATRPAELGTKREPAPRAEVLREGVMTPSASARSGTWSASRSPRSAEDRTRSIAPSGSR